MLELFRFLTRRIIGSPWIQIPCLILHFHAVSAASDSAVSKFRNEAIGAWSQLEERSTSGSGTIRMNFEIIDGEKKVAKPSRIMTFEIDHARLRLDTIIESVPPENFSFLAADNYGARLKQDNDSGKYRVEWLGSPSDLTRSVREGTYFPNGFEALWSLWSIPMRRIVGKKEFRLHGAEEVEMNGEKRIVLKFDCVADDPAIRFYDATVTMSPEDQWAIIEADFVVSPKRDWKYTTKNEFDRRADGNLIRRRTSISTHAMNSDIESHRVFEFDRLDFTAPSDRDFTLTHYGLPEPAIGIGANLESKTHIWLFVAAISLFSIGFGLNRAARRIA